MLLFATCIVLVVREVSFVRERSVERNGDRTPTEVRSELTQKAA